jgi:hypothetical protein
MLRRCVIVLGLCALGLLTGCGESKMARLKRAAAAGVPDDPQAEANAGPQMPGPPTMAKNAPPNPTITTTAIVPPNLPTAAAQATTTPPASSTQASAAPAIAPVVVQTAPRVSQLTAEERRLRTIKNLTASRQRRRDTVASITRSTSALHCS